MKDKIKILISYHKECEIVKSELMIPIQVGAKGSSIDLKMLHDDTGINISEKNDRYCELTAQYWAWKNLDAEFYGFMHYRRHFIFRDIEYHFDDGRPISYKCINKKYKEEIGLNDEVIYECINGYDLILPLAVDTSSWGAISNEVQFSCLENLHAKDFDTVCKTVIELYPDYQDAVQEFRIGHYAYWYNMFIMRKKIFTDYCEWLFHILKESEKNIDFEKYDTQERRVLAFMAERLFSIYIIKLLKDNPMLKMKSLKMTFVHNTDRLLYESIDDIKVPIKKYSGVNYVCCVEKAYNELNKLQMPYCLEDLVQIENRRLEQTLYEKELIFYGGGDWSEQFLAYFDRLEIDYPIEIWDKEAKCNQTIKGIRVVKPDVSLIPQKLDKLWVITIRNRETSDAVKHFLKCNGIRNIVENRELIRWMSYKLWLSING